MEKLHAWVFTNLYELTLSCPIRNIRGNSSCRRKMRIDRNLNVHKAMNYSAINKNEIMSFAKKWMELEIIILNKTNQAQRDKHCLFLLICGI
jgi:hypothetical protein